MAPAIPLKLVVVGKPSFHSRGHRQVHRRWLFREQHAVRLDAPMGKEGEGNGRENCGSSRASARSRRAVWDRWLRWLFRRGRYGVHEGLLWLVLVVRGWGDSCWRWDELAHDGGSWRRRPQLFGRVDGREYRRRVLPLRIFTSVSADASGGLDLRRHGPLTTTDGISPGETTRDLGFPLSCAGNVQTRATFLLPYFLTLLPFPR